MGGDERGEGGRGRYGCCHGELGSLCCPGVFGRVIKISRVNKLAARVVVESY